MYLILTRLGFNTLPTHLCLSFTFTMFYKKNCRWNYKVDFFYKRYKIISLLQIYRRISPQSQKLKQWLMYAIFNQRKETARPTPLLPSVLFHRKAKAAPGTQVLQIFSAYILQLMQISSDIWFVTDATRTWRWQPREGREQRNRMSKQGWETVQYPLQLKRCQKTAWGSFWSKVPSEIPKLQPPVESIAQNR